MTHDVSHAEIIRDGRGFYGSPLNAAALVCEYVSEAAGYYSLHNLWGFPAETDDYILNDPDIYPYVLRVPNHILTATASLVVSLCDASRSENSSQLSIGVLARSLAEYSALVWYLCDSAEDFEMRYLKCCDTLRDSLVKSGAGRPTGPEVLKEVLCHLDEIGSNLRKRISSSPKKFNNANVIGQMDPLNGHSAYDHLSKYTHANVLVCDGLYSRPPERDLWMLLMRSAQWVITALDRASRLSHVGHIFSERAQAFWHEINFLYQDFWIDGEA